MICIKCKSEIDDGSLYCRFCGKKQSTTSGDKKSYKRPSGSGTVRKLSGHRANPWNARVTVKGKQISLGCYPTKAQALKEIEAAHANGISSWYDMTVEQVYNHVCELKKDLLTKSGLTNYESGFKYLQPYKNMKMRNLRTCHIQEAIDEAEKSGIGYATWKKIQNIASLMCQAAMANDLLDKNYAQLVTMPQKKEKTEKVSFTRDQLETMWGLCSDRSVAGILLMCYTGLRLNEFLDIKKDWVDLDNNIIHAEGSKTEAGKNRIIVVPQRAKILLDLLIKTQGEYLYPSPSGKRCEAKNYRDRDFYATLDKYGLNPTGEITPHSCRHTYAMLCVVSGVDQKATMDSIGHSKYSTTLEIYADATKKDVDYLRREINKIT